LDTNGGLRTVPLNGSLVLDAAGLSKLARERCADYAAAKPYPHIVLDNVLPADALDRVIADFPTPDNAVWKQYKSQYEGKLETQGEGHISAFTSLFLYQLNSAPFLRFLEELTGIQALLPDPYFVGGGLHQIPRGGKLGIHADFHRHTKFPLERRLNALIYLNKDWKDEYGGHLELWDRDMKTCAQKIAPIFNRIVVFTITDWAFHGHPEPLQCPEGMTRKSIALYYFTVGRPAGEVKHERGAGDTHFVARPGEAFQDDPEPSGWKHWVRRLIPPILVDAVKGRPAK
jgi:hypothetical protein